MGIAYAKRGCKTIADLDKFEKVLMDAGIASHLIAANNLSKQRPVKLDADPFAEAIDVLGKRGNVALNKLEDVYGNAAQDAIAQFKRAAEKKLAEAIAKEAAEGAMQKEGVGLLGKIFDAIGITPRNSFAIENIFRTQTLAGFGGGRWIAAQEDAVQEILEAWQYVTAGDDRVRPEHEALDGMTAPNDHPVWQMCWPPNGYSCRCQCIMAFGDWEEWVPDEATLLAAVTPGFGYNMGELFG